jgi:hypothetical protein
MSKSLASNAPAATNSPNSVCRSQCSACSTALTPLESNARKSVATPPPEAVGERSTTLVPMSRRTDSHRSAPLTRFASQGVSRASIRGVTSRKAGADAEVAEAETEAEAEKEVAPNRDG